MSLRARFLAWLAQGLDVPIYFELLPVAKSTFDKLDVRISAHPVYMDWDNMKQYMWPHPDQRYRVFVQPEQKA